MNINKVDNAILKLTALVNLLTEIRDGNVTENIIDYALAIHYDKDFIKAMCKVLDMEDLDVAIAMSAGLNPNPIVLKEAHITLRGELN